MAFRKSCLRKLVFAAALAGLAAAVGWLALREPPAAPPASTPAADAPAPSVEPPKAASALPQPGPAAPDPPRMAHGLQTKPPDPDNAPISNLYELHRRIEAFQSKLAQYRAENPVFLNFIHLFDETLLPLARTGVNACLELQERGVELVFLEMANEVGDTLLPPLKNLGVEIRKMAESGKLQLTEKQYAETLDLLDEIDAIGAQPKGNPYPVDSVDYLKYNASVGDLVFLGINRIYEQFLRQASPELERERTFLEFEYRRLTAGSTDAPSFADVAADPFDQLVQERLQYLEAVEEWMNAVEPAQSPPVE